MHILLGLIRATLNMLFSVLLLVTLLSVSCGSRSRSDDPVALESLVQQQAQVIQQLTSRINSLETKMNTLQTKTGVIFKIWYFCFQLQVVCKQWPITIIKLFLSFNKTLYTGITVWIHYSLLQLKYVNIGPEIWMNGAS